MTSWSLTFVLLLRHGSPRTVPYDGKPCTEGRCRPSFLIIGVGKCGTSSLYYYLTGHPKVKEASQKQIQWFDHQYQPRHFADSYLRHFPSLKKGEMTGEASPGYVAYSQVPGRVVRHLPSVRILCIVRDPAERAYSAYHYNYLSVASEPLSFEDLITAEIAFLKTQCNVTATSFLDLSSKCYGAHSADVQAGAIARGKKDALPRANAHLWRQLVGRSLYILYLDHWFQHFPAEDIFIVCSERLGDPTVAPFELDDVGNFLGLPAFDFTPVVAKGKYNAGASHAGYRSVTSWDRVPDLEEKRPPMPEEARAKIDAFVHPFNTRLFHGRDSCPNWERSSKPQEEPRSELLLR